MNKIGSANNLVKCYYCSTWLARSVNHIRKIFDKDGMKEFSICGKCLKMENFALSQRIDEMIEANKLKEEEDAKSKL